MYMFTNVLLPLRDLSSTVLTKEAVTELNGVVQLVRNVTIPVNGTNLTLEDFCLRPISTGVIYD
jgi:hypothetical protein